MHYTIFITLALLFARAAYSQNYPCGASTNIGSEGTCEEFAQQHKISLDKFKMLNPGVKCPQLKRGEFYCYEESHLTKTSDGNTSSTLGGDTTTAASPSTTTKPTTLVTPSTSASPTATDGGSATMTTTTAPSTSSTQAGAPNSAPNTRVSAQTAATYGWLTMSVLMGYYLCTNVRL